MVAASRFRGSLRFLGKGHVRILVLRVLAERPMHGYEVMRALEARFHGLYTPSPGAIYPALAGLRRDGYLTVRGEHRRKTYGITRKGRAYLRGRRAEFEARLRSMEAAVGPERAALVREMRATAHLLAANLPGITPSQARRLTALMVEMRERIGTIVSD